MPSNKTQPVLKTAVSGAPAPSRAPAIALVSASTTQVPIHSVTALTYSAGEQPIHYVKMKDGTVVPVPENQLVQGTGVVMY